MVQPTEKARKTEASAMWPLLHRRLEAASTQLEAARTEEQFREIGYLCEEVLLVLAVAVFDRERHSTIEGRKLRLTDPPKQLLDAYVSTEFAGSANDPLLRSLKSALDVVQAGKTPTYQTAKPCLNSTQYIVDNIAVSAGFREPTDTIETLCYRYIEATKDIGLSHRYTLQKIARSKFGKKIAARLKPADVIEYCRQRRNEVAAATVNQDVVFLRVLLKKARDAWGLEVSTASVDEAARALREEEIVAHSTPRNRRPRREELEALVDYFDKQEKDPRTKLRMKDIMEFTLWSARPISDICRLRWKDLNENARTCTVREFLGPGGKQARAIEFPLLGKAWDIVQRQPRVSDRIFPFNSKSASASYTKAKKELGIENLTLQDLRREAAIRLAEAGVSVEEIARVTGRMDLNTLLKDITSQRAASANEKKPSGARRRLLQLE